MNRTGSWRVGSRACGVVLAAAGLTTVGAALGAGGPGADEVDVPAIPLEVLDQMHQLPGQLGVLPPVEAPPDNPTTPEKVELGRRLFFEAALSRDLSTSCATCHAPDKGFGDGRPLAVGFNGKVLGRHTPTVLNTAYNTAQFWDGRAATLEQQAMGPIMAAGEMNMGTEDLVIERLRMVPSYVEAFQKVYGAEPSLELVGKAIAAYERTVVLGNSPFDRYAAGDKTALTDDQKRGLLLFIGKASCTQCHSGVNFTDNKYHNLGTLSWTAKADPGRTKVSGSSGDEGAFKTPSVRNAELTAPYMHDGSIATLEDLVDFYDRGGGLGANKSPLAFPLNLSDQEKKDLVAFIKALTGTPTSGPAPGETAAAETNAAEPFDDEHAH